jgi:aliphatic nitrilase
MESGCFVVNATGWLTDKQRSQIAPDPSFEKFLQGGMCTAVVSPDGRYLAGPLSEGEDMAVAGIDLKAIGRQKTLLDTAGHYARPDILRLKLDSTPRTNVEEMSERLVEVPDERHIESMEHPHSRSEDD